MSLADLAVVGLPARATIEGKSLPQWLRDRDRARSAPKVDPVEAAFATARQEQDEQNRIDAEGLRICLRAKQIHTHSNPQPGELEMQHRRNRRLATAEAVLTGDHNNG